MTLQIRLTAEQLEKLENGESVYGDPEEDMIETSFVVVPPLEKRSDKE